MENDPDIWEIFYSSRIRMKGDAQRDYPFFRLIEGAKYP